MSYVYMIGPVGYDKPVKIGRSMQPEWRLKDFQCGSPVPLEIKAVHRASDAGLVEAYLHRLLKSVRLHGEWFDATPDEVIARADWCWNWTSGP